MEHIFYYTKFQVDVKQLIAIKQTQHWKCLKFHSKSSQKLYFFEWLTQFQQSSWSNKYVEDWSTEGRVSLNCETSI